MLDIHSQWPEGGIGVEAGLVELYRLMELGKFKVFKHLKTAHDFKDGRAMFRAKGSTLHDTVMSLEVSQATSLTELMAEAG